MSNTTAYIVATLSGIALWLGTMAVSGRREAWDSSLYWTVAYPAAILVSAALGYLASHKAWRWGLTVMLVQAVTMAAAASSFGLLPLGLIMFGILAVPPVGAAMISARFGEKEAR